MSLQDKTAVVTGGSRGIGAAIARALVREGAALVVAARSRPDVDAVAADLRAAGGKVWSAQCDVGNPDDVTALAEQAMKQLTRVDILVNNAGVARSAPLGKISRPDWEEHLRVNATGTFACTQAFLPGMVQRGWGRIVNVASVAGLAGARYIAAYAASKHAVVGFTRSVAAEVAARGVTINAVCPGYVDSPMTDATIARIVAATGRSRAEALESILATSPQHRLLTPEEVADAVVYLCSDAARGINGHALVLDGGELPR